MFLSWNCAFSVSPNRRVSVMAESRMGPKYLSSHSENRNTKLLFSTPGLVLWRTSRQIMFWQDLVRSRQIPCDWSWLGGVVHSLFLRERRQTRCWQSVIRGNEYLLLLMLWYMFCEARARGIKFGCRQNGRSILFAWFYKKAGADLATRNSRFESSTQRISPPCAWFIYT